MTCTSDTCFSKDSNSEENRGVSLIEILLVLVIVLIIGGTVSTFSTGFLVRNQFKNKVNEIISSIQIARLNAISGKGTSKWGVYINSNEITLFQGDSYAARVPTYDQSFSIPSTILITPAEVVFNVINGDPDATKTITITSNVGDSNTVTVNEVGTVDIN